MMVIIGKAHQPERLVSCNRRTVTAAEGKIVGTAYIRKYILVKIIAEIIKEN